MSFFDLFKSKRAPIAVLAAAPRELPEITVLRKLLPTAELTKHLSLTGHVLYFKISFPLPGTSELEFEYDVSYRRFYGMGLLWVEGALLACTYSTRHPDPLYRKMLTLADERFGVYAMAEEHQKWWDSPEQVEVRRVWSERHAKEEIETKNYLQDVLKRHLCG